MMELFQKLLAGVMNKVSSNEVIKDERGDTNFISIAIILVVVLLIAVVFITFGQSLLPKLQAAINNVFSLI